MKVVRSYRPDRERQQSVLLLLLSTSRPPFSHDAGISPADSDGEVPWSCLRQDGATTTVTIIWSAAGPPVGDDHGPFDHVWRIPLQEQDYCEDNGLASATLAEYRGNDERCQACGAPLLWEDLICACELDAGSAA